MQHVHQSEFINPLCIEDFPLILEQGVPKAIVMDLNRYREIELLLDNLLNLRAEAEDELIRDSGIIEKLMARVKDEVKHSPLHRNWREELNAL